MKFKIFLIAIVLSANSSFAQENISTAIFTNENSSWSDTTLHWCAERLLNNGNTVNWFNETQIYIGNELSQSFLSYTGSGNTYYDRTDYNYLSNLVQRDQFSSLDSINWTLGGRFTEYSTPQLDSSNSFSWDGVMFNLDNSQISYKTNGILDSIKYWDGIGQQFYEKKIYYRNNLSIDSIVTYVFNSGWDRFNWEVFDTLKNKSTFESLIYQPYVRYWNVDEVEISRVNYDMNWILLDSNYQYYSNGLLDSVASFNNLLTFNGAVSYSYSALENIQRNWNSNSFLINSTHFYFNAYGDYIGRQQLASDSTVISKISICSIFNELRFREEIEKTNLFIYPNPSSEYIKIEPLTDDVNYSIFNTLGQIVKNGRAEQILDITNLPNGYYQIIIFNEDEITMKSFQKL